MSHRNAPLTPTGRARLVSLINDHGWTQRRAAERFNVSPATAHRWVARHRSGEPLDDRSNRLPARRERRIIKLRFTHRWGPHRISYRLGIARSTVGRVLDRYNMPALDCIDQATGLPVRKAAPNRYERTRPGELVHVDIKKLGKIPVGGGWKAHCRGSAQDLAAKRQREQHARAGRRPTAKSSGSTAH